METPTRGMRELSAAGMLTVAARSAVLCASLGTLVLVRTPIPVGVLAAVVAGSILAVYVTERGRGTFRPWAFYLLGFALFAHLRTLADETGIRAHAQYVIDLEQTVFLGQVPTLWLQDRLHSPGVVGAVDVFATAIHLSYFVAPHVLAIVLWRASRAHFRRYARELLGAAYLGLAVSFAVPTTPPWLAGQSGGLPFVHRVVEDVVGGFTPAVYRHGYEVVATNPVAAMPSLHMAMTVVVVFAAWRLHAIAGLLATAYAASMGFALVYGGEHYAVDVLAGVLTAATSLVLVARIGRAERLLLRSARRLPSLAAPPTAARPGEPA